MIHITAKPTAMGQQNTSARFSSPHSRNLEASMIRQTLMPRNLDLSFSQDAIV